MARTAVSRAVGKFNMKEERGLRLGPLSPEELIALRDSPPDRLRTTCVILPSG